MPLGTFDDVSYARLATANAPRYRQAAPFPHIVLDNFVDVRLARAVQRVFPAPEDPDWVHPDHDQTRKRYQYNEVRLPQLIRQMLREFNSQQFILFLETLTGIENLIPDPFFIGGGAHLSGRGDFLKVHADFNWHHKLQLHRRVNALWYLSDDWDEAWGGALGFWDKDMTRAVDEAYPHFNRIVVFNTGEDSNHGHPEPIQCPEGRYRRALNLYYYTSQSIEGDISLPHFTLYRTEASPYAMKLGSDYRTSAESATGS
jgi:hypothetical protein